MSYTMSKYFSLGIYRSPIAFDDLIYQPGASSFYTKSYYFYYRNFLAYSLVSKFWTK